MLLCGFCVFKNEKTMSILKKKILLLLMVNLLSPTSILASNELSVLIEKALKTNLSIKQVELQKEMQLQRVDQVGVLPDPTVSYSFFGESVQTKTGPQEQKFGITQRIPWLGKLSNEKEVAKKKAAIEETKISQSKSRMVYQIRSLWAEMQTLYINHDIADSTLRLYKNWNQKLLADLKVGTTSYANVLKMEIEIEKINDDIQSIKNQLRNLKYQIHFLVGDSDANEIKRESSYRELILSIDVANDLDNFLIDNPQIKENKALMGLYKSKESLSQKAFFPNFSLGVGYIQTGEGPSAMENGKDPWLINVGMSIPLSLSKNSASVRENELGYQKAKYKNEYALLEIEKNKTQIINNFQESRRQRITYENEILPRLNKSLSFNKKQYEQRQINFIELLDDYRMIYQTRQKISNSLSKEFQNKIKLLWLLGDESTNFKMSQGN